MPGTQRGRSARRIFNYTAAAAACGIAAALGRSNVVPKEPLDHRVHLVGDFELIEVSGADRPAIDDVRQPLRHQVRWIEGRCRRQMESRHLAQCGSSRTVEFENSPYGIGGDVVRRGQHYCQYRLDQLLVRSREEQMIGDELPAGLLITGLDIGGHGLDRGAICASCKCQAAWYAGYGVAAVMHRPGVLRFSSEHRQPARAPP